CFSARARRPLVKVPTTALPLSAPKSKAKKLVLPPPLAMSGPPRQMLVADVTRRARRRQLYGSGLRPSICGVRRPRVEICGITRPEDALAAANAGADAIGIVFYKAAPRCVSDETAAAILRVLPPFVTPVGLFVDATAAEINETARRLGLRHVQ